MSNCGISEQQQLLRNFGIWGEMRGMGWSIKKIDSLQAMSLFQTIAIASQF
jgi:hypothetical protein